MTTIAWDGVNLATDTQTTVRAIKGLNTCTVCKEKSHHCEFNENKLTVGFPKTSKFRGEQVLATALSGDHDFCVSLVEMLKNNEDIETICRGAAKLKLLEEIQASLIVMTTESLFLFDLEYGLLEVQDMTNKPFCVGSGRSLARHLIAEGKSAMEAVAECIKWDDYTGGTTVWTDRPSAERDRKHNYKGD